MSNTPRRYARAFKREAVRLSESTEKNVAQLARDLTNHGIRVNVSSGG